MNTLPNDKANIDNRLRIKELVASNNTELAIIELKKELSDNSNDLYDELISLQANFNDLEKRIRTNVIEAKDINIEKSIINNSILKIANKAFEYEKFNTSNKTPAALIRSTNTNSKIFAGKLFLGLSAFVVLLIGISRFGISDKASRNNLSGKWEMILFYKSCKNKQDFNNKLVTFYELEIQQNKVKLNADGRKFKERFQSKETIYSADIPVMLSGIVDDDLIIMNFAETNVEGVMIPGEIKVVQMEENSKYYQGTFKFADFKCSGRVELKRS